MKKSPLSTPSGSRGKQSYNWKSYDYKSRTGYSYVKSDSYQCVTPSGNQNQNKDDFIPLSNSTPVTEQKRHSGNWYGSGRSRNHRNSGSGGYNHYRNNYHATPKSNFNNSCSPYKHSGKQFRGHKKGYQRDVNRQVDISRYIDMKSFLEDPWAELMKKLNELKEINEEKLPKLEHSFALSAVSVDSKLDPESKSGTDFEDLQFSQESRNESSVDVSLGLDDTNLSNLSKQESSIDVKHDNEQNSQESKNKSFSSTNESDCGDVSTEDNVNFICDAKTVTVQESI